MQISSNHTVSLKSTRNGYVIKVSTARSTLEIYSFFYLWLQSWASVLLRVPENVWNIGTTSESSQYLDNFHVVREEHRQQAVSTGLHLVQNAIHGVRPCREIDVNHEYFGKGKASKQRPFMVDLMKFSSLNYTEDKGCFPPLRNNL